MRFSFRDNIKQVVRELTTGLRRLTFADNMESFSAEVTIAANTEKEIRNELTIVPSYVIINSSGNALVTKGDTSDTTNFVYLKNHDSTNSATVKAIWFK